jgi:hypothetical protein
MGHPSETPPALQHEGLKDKQKKRPQAAFDDPLEFDNSILQRKTNRTKDARNLSGTVSAFDLVCFS